MHCWCCICTSVISILVHREGTGVRHRRSNTPLPGRILYTGTSIKILYNSSILLSQYDTGVPTSGQRREMKTLAQANDARRFHSRLNPASYVATTHREASQARNAQALSSQRLCGAGQPLHLRLASGAPLARPGPEGWSLDSSSPQITKRIPHNRPPPTTSIFLGGVRAHRH